MTNIEYFQILCKQWADVNDIKCIAKCGRDTARTIRDSIMSDIEKDGLYLPSTRQKIVPMSYVVDYLNIDVDYIANMAIKEKNLIM